ncbi:MAG: hypothetical protein IJL91_04270 [Bacteroidales bacterium]|nr:hypothetical protein [Bacteroidales bacterium]MBQ6576945.1 hypothetical protein [Bacteroidales bacterium]
MAKKETDKLQRRLILCQCLTVVSILFLLGKWQKGMEWLFWSGVAVFFLSLILQGILIFLIIKKRKNF